MKEKELHQPNGVFGLAQAASLGSNGWPGLTNKAANNNKWAGPECGNVDSIAPFMLTCFYVNMNMANRSNNSAQLDPLL